MGVGPLKRAVFLDRDGVLNRAIVRDGKPYPPSSVEELEILHGVPQGLARLKQLGFELIVVTNQPDIARGTQSMENLDAIHAALQDALPLDAIYVCAHDGPDGCDCRKPKPGLLLQASNDRALALGECFLIGDRWRDIDAAEAAGVPAVWIDYGYQEQGPRSAPLARVDNFLDAVRCIEDALLR
jgi:D-glycero-D-manno-heptose 1,7-bisphosphate phosphatase